MTTHILSMSYQPKIEGDSGHKVVRLDGCNTDRNWRWS